MKKQPETQEARWRVYGDESPVEEWVRLLDTEKGRLTAPARQVITVEVTGVPGIGQLIIEADLNRDDRRYDITRADIRPPRGESLNLITVRTIRFGEYLTKGIASRVEYTDHTTGERYTADNPIPSPDTSMSVALTYTVAHALRMNPTKAVADQFELKPDAAAQRVKRARDKGYLPPTTQGKTS